MQSLIYQLKEDMIERHRDRIIQKIVLGSDENVRSTEKKKGLSVEVKRNKREMGVCKWIVLRCLCKMWMNYKEGVVESKLKN